METYLTFMLENEYFAVSVSKVLEVLEKQQITRVPKTPKHIMGIINFRGEILSVVDMRKKFGLTGSQNTGKQVVIVFEVPGKNGEKTPIAATADSVKDVIDIKENEIKPVPELGLTYDSRFIQGAVHFADGFILLLDIEKVFSVKDLAIATNIKIEE